MSTPQVGEQLVGAYHSIINECELVSYNGFSRMEGDQMEVDILGIKSENGEQRVYACEVVTHLDGMDYGGKPSTDYWEDFGSQKYQGTLDTVYHKFCADYEYVARVFDSANEYKFQLWSPYVSEGYLTDGLEEVQRRFNEKASEDIELVINERYSDKIQEMKDRAGTETKRYGEPAYRFMQILEHMR